jgi:Zn-dependent peptidase ImmA (M78 family)/transcriptional regulator with XRE-family HTH domain
MGTRHSHDQPQLGLLAGAAVQAEDVRDAWDAARLTQARLLAGLTKQEVAQELGVPSAAIGQWETGVRSPRVEHIAGLARVLAVPVAFFRIGRPQVRMNAACAHFRSLWATRSSQRDKAIAFVEQLWELTHAIERRIELPPVDVPGLVHGERTSEKVPTEPGEAARFLRSAWDIPPGPFPHLVRTLENHGIVVSHVPFAGEDTARIDAFSTSHLTRPLVVTTPDKADDVFRHRFTVAHELGHLVMHHDAQPGAPQQEREANAFAAELLMPAAKIEDQLPRRLRLGALHPLADVWGVSLQALIYRTRELGLVTEVAARRAYQKCRLQQAAGTLRAEPITLYRGETPVLLRRAFELAERHNLLTLDDLANELAWAVARVRLLLGFEDERPCLTLVRD